MIFLGPNCIWECIVYSEFIVITLLKGQKSSESSIQYICLVGFIQKLFEKTICFWKASFYNLKKFTLILYFDERSLTATLPFVESIFFTIKTLPSFEFPQKSNWAWSVQKSLTFIMDTDQQKKYLKTPSPLNFRFCTTWSEHASRVLISKVKVKNCLFMKYNKTYTRLSVSGENI